VVDRDAADAAGAEDARPVADREPPEVSRRSEHAGHLRTGDRAHGLVRAKAEAVPVAPDGEHEVAVADGDVLAGRSLQVACGVRFECALHRRDRVRGRESRVEIVVGENGGCHGVGFAVWGLNVGAFEVFAGPPLPATPPVISLCHGVATFLRRSSLSRTMAAESPAGGTARQPTDSSGFGFFFAVR
jgi:hypothetical protein